MRTSMIMAMDLNQLIGKDGGMPWHIPSDLKYFKRITMGKPVVMGRRTFESLGKPLPGRANIVVTTNSDWSYEGVQVASTLEQAFELAAKNNEEEIMIIGGASICQQAMPHTDRLYLTRIDHEFEGGDTWLKSYRAEEWRQISSESHDETSEGGYRYTYNVLERVDK